MSASVTNATEDDLARCSEIEMHAIAFIEKRDLRRLTVREKIAVGMAVNFTFNTLRCAADL